MTSIPRLDANSLTTEAMQADRPGGITVMLVRVCSLLPLEATRSPASMLTGKRGHSAYNNGW